jgi:hypothetical protein
MGLKELRALGKERGFKGLTRHKKDELIALLRGGKPAPAAAPGRSLKASTSSLTALEDRLERMEALLQRIATRLEVS